MTQIGFSFAKRHQIVSENTETHTLIYHHAHINPNLFSELQRIATLPISLVKLEEAVFQKKLTKTYELNQGAAQEVLGSIEETLDLKGLIQDLPQTEDLLEAEGDAPVIQLLNAILYEGVKQSASDIHVETYQDNLLVRFRIDGMLQEALEPPKVLAPLIVSRLKIMAKLNIAEKRLPQDGRISLKLGGRAIDVRVSSIPTNHGERLVLRLLDKDAKIITLESFGLAEKSLSVLRDLIFKPHGIILVTGPTGSGKSTTLYAALTELNDITRNILTVEDPIEYDLSGVGQMAVNNKIGMTFAKGLRAMLRQDPDVVMVGEIRDTETAQTAVQASLTGHLVMSTLHTNSAIGAITRLKDMDIESFLLSTTLTGVIAQRLIRLLCSHCKEAKTVDKHEQDFLSCDSPQEIYHVKGCEHCNQTGYKGRAGIYEVIAIDAQLAQMIHQDVSEKEMEDYARKSSLSMLQDGCRKVLAGETSLEEILRVTKE